MLKIKAIQLSNNPTAQVSADGKYNVMKDGRLYFMIVVADALNPFGPTRQRMISQQFNSTTNLPEWKVDLDDIKAAMEAKAVIPGDIVTMEVAPYEVGKNKATSYSSVVFKHETAESVFLNSGHKPVGCTRELPPRFRTGLPLTPEVQAETEGAEANLAEVVPTSKRK